MVIQDNPQTSGTWLSSLFESKQYGKFTVPPCWGQSHVDLKYINEPFNDPVTESLWRSQGYTQNRFTGDLYDMRFAEPTWMDFLRRLIPWKNFAWSIYRMMPGTVLPEHSDTYVRFRQIYGLSSEISVRRAIIFLEDWQSGHYLEVARDAIVHWQAGDGIYWDDTTSHLAANMGHTPRYTLQITGTLDDHKIQK